MLKTAMTAAALGLAAISTAATAGSNDVPRTEVKVADLNLGTAEGQERLDQRIHAAAKKMCKVGQPRSTSRIPSADSQKCYDAALNSTRAQVASLIEAQRRGG